jgi:site-specific recombinase XerD
MRGVPLRAIQELLGHATIDMTMRYAHLAPDVTRDAVQLLDAPAPVRKASGAE